MEDSQINVVVFLLKSSYVVNKLRAETEERTSNMEEEKKEAVGEPSEAANEQKEEKKNAKVVINQFVEKHGKKKCIIYGSVIGAAVLALVLGLGIGLGGNKEAPIIEAKTWKERADEIAALHESADYKAPSKVTVSVKTKDKTAYSDGMTDDSVSNATFAIDTDNFMIYGKSYDNHQYTGDTQKITYHHGDESYVADSEFWFWLEESENRAYIMATVGTETKSMYSIVTDQKIAELKADPDQGLRDLCDDCEQAFDNQLRNLKAYDFLEYYSWADPDSTITALSDMFPPAEFYDEYYDDFMDDGIAYVDGGDLAADYTKTSLELRSSGAGNVSFAFSGKTDEDITDYSSAGVDEVTHVSAKVSYKLSYDNYCWSGYDIEKKGTVNLTFDLTAECDYNVHYNLDYTAKIKKPTAKNLINTMA